MSRNLTAAVCGWLAVTVATFAQPGGEPDYDFDWVTIGNPGNAAFVGSPNEASYPDGRGSVGYEFRMTRTEITTGQWLEFLNTWTARPGVTGLTFEWDPPTHWGATLDGSYQGPGLRYRLRNVPDAERRPVVGITWRQSAQFVNWLHNNKSSEPSAIVTGAYDTTTWGGGFGTPITDAPNRLPGARFAIPTIDEWIKSTHYDPDRNGQGQGGWWLYPNQSDSAPVSGLPGLGQTSAGTGVFTFPVGSYPDQVSAYGLQDTSGSASEWTEEVQGEGTIRYGRFTDGSSASESDHPTDRFSNETIYRASGVYSPTYFAPTVVGLRIVSIPTPAGAGVWVMAAVVLTIRKRR